MRFRRTSIPLGASLVFLFLASIIPLGFKKFSLLFHKQATPTLGRIHKNNSSEVSLEDLRFELLVSLDLFIRAQKVLQQETGAFSSALGRIPDVLGPIQGIYKIEIEQANRNNLIITATGTSESELFNFDFTREIARDRVVVDQNFNLKSSFPLPTPPASFLKTLSQFVLNRILINSAMRIPEENLIQSWEGIYAGNFKYENRKKSSGEVTIVAVPITEMAQAVLGTAEIEVESGFDLVRWIGDHRKEVFSELEAKYRLKELFIAQKIRQRLSGSYERSLSNLGAFWRSLTQLNSSAYYLRLDNLELDPVFGYQAEIAVLGESDQIRGLWSINGYGQTAQINPVEELMGRLNKARKVLDSNRKVSGEKSNAVKSDVDILDFEKISDH